MSLYRVSAVQMVSTYDVEANLRSAELLIEQSAQQGAHMVVLPENFAVLDSGNLLHWGQQEQASGIFTQFLSEQSKKHELWIVGGTIPLVQMPNGNPVDEGRVRAANLIYNDQGELVSRYDKIHLFDVQVNDSQGSYKESKIIEPGDVVVAAQTPAGLLGQTICYDLRFPELYSALANRGCVLLTVPSAFTARTGQAHWQALLQARAIENQCFVIAPNQGGQHSKKRHTWGHSMVVDPWGAIIAQYESGPGLAMADLDFEWLKEIRDAMPVQQHKRFSVVMNP